MLDLAALKVLGIEKSVLARFSRLNPRSFNSFVQFGQDIPPFSHHSLSPQPARLVSLCREGYVDLTWGVMSPAVGNHLVSVHPDVLRFQFELDRQSFCDLKVVNNTELHVAIKVKTTSPKKYFVRPNTGVLHPWDSCIIRVTLQAQREYPPDMQCKDKFLLQSAVVAANAEVEDLPLDTFNKEDGKTVEECKLRVVYVSSSSIEENSEDEMLKSSTRNLDNDVDLQSLKEERDLSVKQTQQLQQELDTLKRRKHKKTDPGFSITFALLVGLVGIAVGFLLNLQLSSSSSE